MITIVSIKGIELEAKYYQEKVFMVPLTKRSRLNDKIQPNKL